MNYKLEKFWNARQNFQNTELEVWTINLKSFEIRVGRSKTKFVRDEL